MKKKVALHNLGCKVNSYELEAMQQLLEQAGYEIVPFEPGADVYVINTCTVTNIADRKSRQMLHKAKKMNPDAVVVATGCYVQTDEGKLETDEAVDLVLGNNQKKNIVEVLAEFEKEHQRQAHIIKINQTKEYEELEISRTAEHVRAYIKVQDGCNQFCTYCIIPYARGRVRSREKENILNEVHKLAKAGYKEVVLTGIPLSSYGVDFPEDKKETLLSLIQAVNEVEGIQRIRLGSLEPGIVTEEFAKELSSMSKVCPHFHLSLQSGCDATLKRMNRRYTAEEYYEKCVLLREKFDHPALTTDVIVGFPGETEEDFEETLDVVSKCGYDTAFTFLYSRRSGTPAAEMEQIPQDVAKERFNRLLALVQQEGRIRSSRFEGSVQEVLVEEESREKGIFTGRTEYNLLVHFPGTADLLGKYVKVSLDECHGFYYMGSLVEE